MSDGHTTSSSSSIAYSSVVSRVSIRIEFLLEYLNDLEIFEGGIGNAYLNASAGRKFGQKRHRVWV